jgi:DNA-nicking Smr family endonuclease
LGKSKIKMEQWLERYPPSEDFLRDREDENNTGRQFETKKQLQKMAPQAELDLHGYTAEDAGREIDRFLTNSYKAGLRKVIIVHGKGNHSSDGGVLAKIAAERVSKHPLAGDNALSKGADGGSGARWVILRQRSR